MYMYVLSTEDSMSIHVNEWYDACVFYLLKIAYIRALFNGDKMYMYVLSTEDNISFTCLNVIWCICMISTEDGIHLHTG